MPYVAVTKEFPGIYSAERLRDGNILYGSIHRQRARVDILGEFSLSLSINGGDPVIQEKIGGALIFDKEGRFLRSRSRVIAYLKPEYADDFDGIKRDSVLGLSAPGVYFDVSSGLFRLGRIQAGDKKAARWTPGRLLEVLMTAGQTERYFENER